MNIQPIAVAIFSMALFGCGKADPRSQIYFEAHMDEAQEIVEGCRDGSVRGDECTNAERAVSRNEAKGRTKRFLGDGKAYTPR